MKVYDFPFSPNSRKVRAVAYELGIPLEYVHTNLLKGESRTPAFLARNPNGRAPVLEDGDFVLWESNAIIAYLATLHRSPLDLCPADARARAEIDRWLDWQLAHLGPAISKVAFERVVKKLRNMGEPDQAIVEAGMKEFEGFIDVLDRSLGDREWLAGRLSIADFAVASHLSVAPTAGLEIAPARAKAWLARVLARDSMKRALAAAQASLSAAA